MTLAATRVQFATPKKSPRGVVLERNHHHVFSGAGEKIEDRHEIRLGFGDASQDRLEITGGGLLGDTPSDLDAQFLAPLITTKTD